MNQRKKEALIGNIRKCSLIVAILCVLCMIVNICIAVSYIHNPSMPSSDPLFANIIIFNITGLLGNACIMLLAAVLFFSMSRSGRPFTPKKIRMVLFIALMMFVKTIIAGIVNPAECGLELYKRLLLILMRGGWMEGILFLIAALIMYYASFLQQESDETL